MMMMHETGVYGDTYRLSTDRFGSARGPSIRGCEPHRRLERRHAIPVLLNDSDQVVDMLSHSHLCSLWLARDDRLDDVAMLVGEGEMGSGFNRNDIEES